MIFGKMKKRTREKIYRTLTLVFLIVFVISVVGVLLANFVLPLPTR